MCPWCFLNRTQSETYMPFHFIRHYMDIIAKTRNKTPSLPLFQRVIHVISGDCWSEQTGTNFMNLPTVRPSRHPPTLSHVTFQTSREVSPKISVVCRLNIPLVCFQGVTAFEKIPYHYITTFEAILAEMKTPSLMFDVCRWIGSRKIRVTEIREVILKGIAD